MLVTIGRVSIFFLTCSSKLGLQISVNFLPLKLFPKEPQDRMRKHCGMETFLSCVSHGRTKGVQIYSSWLPYLQERSMALCECAGVEVNLTPAGRTRGGRMYTVMWCSQLQLIDLARRKMKGYHGIYLY
jgi:hypothetical protein